MSHFPFFKRTALWTWKREDCCSIILLFGGNPGITNIDFLYFILRYNELPSVKTRHHALLSDHTKWKLCCLSGTLNEIQLDNCMQAARKTRKIVQKNCIWTSPHLCACIRNSFREENEEEKRNTRCYAYNCSIFLRLYTGLSWFQLSCSFIWA